MRPHSYELGDDGLYYILLYGRRSTGSKTYRTEAEAQSVVAGNIEESCQADEADAIYSRMYGY